MTVEMSLCHGVDISGKIMGWFVDLGREMIHAKDIV